ncbi:MAG: bacillithiol biosynthesis cysteine-adding enzyme BshC [Trueperaceae bacterium]|nr:bacillithiol biosynthesis cysteine-adding enzyme BshC [Trueperaceae bacterium]
MPNASRSGGAPPAPSFLDAYLRGDLSRFFDVAPGDVAAGLARPYPGDRAALADALDAQATARGDGPGPRRAIQRLRHPDARVVVTGQQPGVLLGPMYALVKAVSAWALAARLDREDRPVVPVYWVASQDHDVDEIARTTLLGPDGVRREVALDLPEGRPSGRIAWREDWTACLQDAVQDLYGATAAATEVRALLEDVTAPGGTVADVFARTLARLLGPRGLVVLDPMKPDLARTFAPWLRRELEAPTVGPEAIRTSGEALRSLGWTPQLGRAAGATNLFVQRGDGPRRLLRVDGDGFHLDGEVGARASAADVAAWLEDDPAAVTPAAGLRPILQDAVLPTAAVVVGPGELRYFAQVRGVYAHHGVAMPLVHPRTRATLLEPPAARILARYGLTAAAVQADPEGVEREVALALHGADDAFTAAAERLERDAADLLDAVRGIDPTLAGPVARSEASVEAAVARLRTKTAAALARRDRVTHAQFARLRAMLVPGGGPQERVVTPFAYFAKFGVTPVLDRLLTLPADGAHELPLDP